MTAANGIGIGFDGASTAVNRFQNYVANTGTALLLTICSYEIVDFSFVDSGAFLLFYFVWPLQK